MAGQAEMTCGGCGAEGVGESCWLCGGDLCLDCWEARGHCGHESAALAQELGRLIAEGHAGPFSLSELAGWSAEDLRPLVEAARERKRGMEEIFGLSSGEDGA